ncbi:MAG: DALR domain-containing protein, partial [Gaiellaceae bacterium]
WRSPIDFSPETMMQARTQVDAFRELFRMKIDRTAQQFPQDWDPVVEARRFEEALENDFNTPEALAILHKARSAWDQDFIRERLGFFGLDSLAAVEEEVPANIAELADRRLAARAERNFAESDRLRDEIAAAGWEVRDISAEPGYQLVKKD